MGWVIAAALVFASVVVLQNTMNMFRWRGWEIGIDELFGTSLLWFGGVSIGYWTSKSQRSLHSSISLGVCACLLVVAGLAQLPSDAAKAANPGMFDFVTRDSSPFGFRLFLCLLCVAPAGVAVARVQPQRYLVAGGAEPGAAVDRCRKAGPGH